MAPERPSLSQRVDQFFLYQRQGRFDFMDGLRGWALVMIFNVHFLGIYEARFYFLGEGSFLNRLLSMFNAGHAGVDLFFILSGFLIYTTIQRKHSGFWRFLLNRCGRLFPALLVVNLPLIAAQAKTIPDVIDNLLILGLFPGTDLYNVVEWALTYQLYFYGLAAVWFIVLAPWRFSQGWAFYWLLAIAIYIQHQTGIFGPTGVPRFMSMIWGVGLAKLYGSPKLWDRLGPRLSWAWPLGIALVYAARWYWAGHAGEIINGRWQWAAYFSCIDLGFLITLTALLSNRGLGRRVLGWKPLRMLGSVSYSAFLIHGVWAIPLAHLLVKSLTPGFDVLALHWLASMGLTVLISLFLYAYLERVYFRPAPSKG